MLIIKMTMNLKCSVVQYTIQTRFILRFHSFNRQHFLFLRVSVEDMEDIHFGLKFSRY